MGAAAGMGRGSTIVIETPRVRLRHLTPDDARFVLELVNEPGWKRYIGDRGVGSLAAARSYIESGPVASYRAHGFGLFALELRESGQPVGICGLLRRDTLPDVDIGYALLERHEGRGLASEAAAATLAWARDTLRLPRVVAIATPDNARSARLLERIGMREEGEIRHGDKAEVLRLWSIDFEAS